MEQETHHPYHPHKETQEDTATQAVRTVLAVAAVPEQQVQTPQEAEADPEELEHQTIMAHQVLHQVEHYLAVAVAELLTEDLMVVEDPEVDHLHQEELQLILAEAAEADLQAEAAEAAALEKLS